MSRLPEAKDCPFCARVADRDYMGRDHETNVVWFKPLNPVTGGHILFTPMSHVTHHDGNAPFEVSYAFESASRFALAQGIEDYNLITSSGSFATQTVEHVHIHLVPRRESDGLLLPWSNQL